MNDEDRRALCVIFNAMHDEWEAVRKILALNGYEPDEWVLPGITPIRTLRKFFDIPFDPEKIQ